MTVQQMVRLRGSPYGTRIGLKCGTAFQEASYRRRELDIFASRIKPQAIEDPILELEQIGFDRILEERVHDSPRRLFCHCGAGRWALPQLDIALQPCLSSNRERATDPYECRSYVVSPPYPDPSNMVAMAKITRLSAYPHLERTLRMMQPPQQNTT